MREGEVMGMYVGFAGSRDYPDLLQVGAYVTGLEDDDIVVSGGARGVDRTAEAMARDLDMRMVSFRPLNLVTGTKNWAIERVMEWKGDRRSVVLPERYPSFAAAAFVRNGYIVELAEKMVVFWDGHSNGTRDTLRKAQAKLGVNGVELYRMED
jgi:hypothetical protein